MVSTHLKNISQIGSFSQVGVKIKNIWNHHLELVRPERCTKRTGGGGKVVVDVDVVKVVDMVVVVTVVFVADLLANNDKQASHTHRIHVWYSYLHLAKMYGKCR